MFGKKKEKDESMAYYGDESYFQNQSFDQSIYEESNGEKRVSTAYLTSIFEPYLHKDEKILCVFGNGRKDGGLNDGRSKRNALKALMIAAPSCIAAYILVYLISGMPKELICFLLLFIFLCMPAIAVVTLIIWVAMNSSSIIANYAVTNKRILAIMQNEWQQISLNDVVCTRIYKMERAIMVTTKVGGRMNNMAIYYVGDPVAAKRILDDAIEKCKAAEARAGEADVRKEKKL